MSCFFNTAAQFGSEQVAHVEFQRQTGNGMLCTSCDTLMTFYILQITHVFLRNMDEINAKLVHSGILRVFYSLRLS